MLIHSIIIINYKVFMFSILFYKNLKFRKVFRNINLMNCDARIWKQLLTIVCIISCFSCVWLCNTMNCSPTGFFVHGILLARILEWVAMSSSRGSSPPIEWTHISCISCIAGDSFPTEPPGKPQTMAFKGRHSSSMLISLKDYRWEAAKEAFIFLDSPL